MTTEAFEQAEADEKRALDRIFKRSRFWEYSPFVMMILVVVCMAVIFFNIPRPTDILPGNITPAYRTIENTGGLLGGRAQYYIFGADGTRYLVTQKLFDQYKDLPRGDK